MTARIPFSLVPLWPLNSRFQDTQLLFLTCTFRASEFSAVVLQSLWVDNFYCCQCCSLPSSLCPRSSSACTPPHNQQHRKGQTWGWTQSSRVFHGDLGRQKRGTNRQVHWCSVVLELFLVAWSYIIKWRMYSRSFSREPCVSVPDVHVCAKASLCKRGCK